MERQDVKDYPMQIITRLICALAYKPMKLAGQSENDIFIKENTQIEGIEQQFLLAFALMTYLLNAIQSLIIFKRSSRES